MSFIFNTEKTAEDYAAKTLFLNKPAGLVDTVHKIFPNIWGLYKEMKSLDWDEEEFDFTSCMVDFDSAPKDVSDMMLKTLMWQWEADSVVSRAPTCIIAPFNPCTEIWATEQRICDNEQVHANTYSEIVRMGTKIPTKVIEELLAETETFRRLDIVSSTLYNIYNYSRKIAQDESYDELEATEYLLRFYLTVLCLERIQFMASFAITFTICKSGWFQPIGMAVRKIAQDELEVHSEYRKEVIREMLKTDLGKQAYENIKDELKNIVKEVIDAELYWTNEYLFKDRVLVGTNAELVSKWVLFNAKDVVRHMGMEFPEYKFPKDNPMPHLEDWLNLNNLQAAPQEQDLVQYKIGSVKTDDSDEEFEI